MVSMQVYIIVNLKKYHKNYRQKPAFAGFYM